MIENVYVAGGIGSGINMGNAIEIGMFPDIPVEMYHYLGNYFTGRCIRNAAIQRRQKERYMKLPRT